MPPKKHSYLNREVLVTQEQTDAHHAERERKRAEKRKARPGQPAPSRPPGLRSSGAAPAQRRARPAEDDSLPDETEYVEDAGAGAGGSAAASGSTGGTQHAQIMQQRYQDFRTQQPQNVLDLQAFAAHAAAAEAQQAPSDAQRTLMQRADLAAKHQHRCAAGATARAEPGSRQVAYFSDRAPCYVRVPMLVCPCGFRQEARPLQLGCCAPTARCPQQLFDWQLLNHNCATKHGGSDAFASTLRYKWTLLEWEVGSGGPPLDPRALGAATMEFRRIKDAALRPDALGGLGDVRRGLGPLPDCPACAIFDVDVSHWQGVVEDYLPFGRHLTALAGDACVKLTHYVKAGLSLMGCKPAMRRFIGEANDNYQEAYRRSDAAARAGAVAASGSGRSGGSGARGGSSSDASGARGASGASGSGAAGAASGSGASGSGAAGAASGSGADGSSAAADEAAAASECPRLRHSCAREEVKRGSSVTDINGHVALVCTHGMPACGGIILMRSAENFSMYDELLTWFTGRWQLRDFYLDTGCIFKKHWARLNLPQPRILVGWFHAAAHVVSCFVKNSGLFAQGTGRRIGENCEQAWSQAKEWASPARFMSEVNYNDFNEDQYSMLTMGKARKFTKQLIETAKLNAKKTSAAAASMEAVIKLAEAGGISKEEILEAVRNLVDPPQPEPEDDMTVRARQMAAFVGYDLEIKALQSSSSGYFPGAAFKDVRRGSQDTARIQKLMGQRDKSLSRIAAPSPDSPQYRAGMVQHRTGRLRECIGKIEQLAGTLQYLHHERPRAGAAGAHSKQLERKKQATRASLNDTIKDLQYWAGLRDASGQPLPDPEGLLRGLPDHWTDDFIDHVIESNGDMWAGAKKLGKAAETAVLAARYHQAAAEVERGQEAQLITKAELFKAKQYYALMAQACERDVQRAESLAAQTVAGARAAAGEASGRGGSAELERASAEQTVAVLVGRLKEWYERKREETPDSMP
ncbi:hypothetical protein Rsub_04691 [Raphidocelis subcapitata]|uniref:CxC3 like cysteine cluster domain-containing protein n=1 Tax=Raphidocelis subcapitata TaxID=307507 RepID=A0A2V0P440_9CHLO|nr:hypothetical protein Rsub_04691 [Raphidocelis subcapitata]|eukprot:GBF91967.1 hypothetical protein Rsub_04691 [Raphidocelis subcapitata]